MPSKTLLSPYLAEYLAEFSPEPKLLAELRERTAESFNDQMMISPEQGRLLNFLTKVIKAHRIMEIGVFTGYSSIWTCWENTEIEQIYLLEHNPEPLGLAREYWGKANLSDKINLIIGEAGDSLEEISLRSQEINSFDLIFIDADKANYPIYYEYALKLTRPGGLIIIDNMLWRAKVTLPIESQDQRTKTLAELNKTINQDSRVDSVLLPVGDGLHVCMKK